jgi:hypothetical protein
LLSSDVKAELLPLFHDDPELVIRMDEVAMRIGNPFNEIETFMKDLVDLGLLREGIRRSRHNLFESTEGKRDSEIIANQLRNDTV